MSGARPWLGFLAMCLGLFMAVLDVQVVASALTAIGASLDVAPERLGWIQTGYLMAEVIAIPLTGVLTRAFTLRWLFTVATAGFTLASLGCALATGLPVLIALRIVQGFFGGMLIPAVFTSVFVMMPPARQTLATTLAGVFAVIAPTVGPLIGGYFTEHHSWRWIFLINLPAGVLVSLVVAMCVRVGEPALGVLRRIDYGGVALASLALAALQLLLNEAPEHGWKGLYVASIAAVTVFSGAWAVLRALGHRNPFVDLRRFSQPLYALGSSLSFVLGMGLYGSVYLLALFLGLVRGHSPLVIGEIMIVSGAAQLVTAPLAAWAETRANTRLLAFAGFTLFAAGLLTNAHATAESDFWALFWPQVLRGAAVMFCLLPATRLALGPVPPEQIPDASALFNLMRNLGGAIGISLAETLIETRTAGHAKALVEQLMKGDAEAARLVGVPAELLHAHTAQAAHLAAGPALQAIGPLVRRAALAQSFNEAWMLLGIAFCLSLAALLRAPARRKADSREEV